MSETAAPEGPARATGMKSTKFQVIRGEITRGELEPDSPPCHPCDLLNTEEVAALRRCSTSKVYKLRKSGVLKGTPGKP